MANPPAAIASALAMLAALGALSATGATAGDRGDPRRGAELYRGCIPCHALTPDTHLTGPSLAGLRGRPAGRVEGFTRYSGALDSAGLTWDGPTLDAWLADPAGLVESTSMTFSGLADETARRDLIAFLEIAMAPGGAAAVVEQGLVPAEFVRGRQPAPLTPTPANAQVAAIRHCGDNYWITTADGTTTPHWEMNVRLKIDTSPAGPEPGQPALIRSGSLGDRISVVFSSIGELKRVLREEC